MELDPRLHTGSKDSADGADAHRRSTYHNSHISSASSASMTPSATSHITLPPPGSLPALSNARSVNISSSRNDANASTRGSGSIGANITSNLSTGVGASRGAGSHSTYSHPHSLNPLPQSQPHFHYPSQHQPPHQPTQHHQDQQYETSSSASPQSQPPSGHGNDNGNANTHTPPQPHLHSHSQPATGPTDNPDDPYGDLKRPRACEACRTLKVRCEPDLSDPHGTCKRCAKARRTCVVTAPTRKRQKKTDSRVAELERKIDALTASLQASGSAPVSASAESGTSVSPGEPALGAGPGSGSEGTKQQQPQQQEQPPRRWLGATAQSGAAASVSPTTTGLTGSKRGPNGEVKDRSFMGSYEHVPSSQSVSSAPSAQQQSGGGPASGSGDTAGRHWRVPSGPGSRANSTSGPGAGGTGEDVIDRGLVSEEVAAQAFDRYVTRMAPIIPMVVFPPGTTMDDVRRSKPLLLHGILSAAVGRFDPDLQVTITTDFYRVIAEKVIVKGEKSLELVQALLVTCNWYMVPDHFEELKFYQMTHLAVTLGIEIGMYRKTSTNHKQFNFLRDVVHKGPLPPNPDSPEVRRAWLGCYFLAVQVTTSLRRAILVRWHPYMDECIDILENSPDALPTDKTMIQWAKLGRILEEINLQFSADDTGSFMSFSEPKVLYSIKVFARQLEQWRKETRLDEHKYGPILSQAECIVDLYLHEGAMHLDTLNNDSSKEEYTTAQMNALNTCIMACHKALDIILAIDIYDLICLPVVSLARTSFAMVALIKLYSIVAVSENSIGQVIELCSLRVEHYLERVLAHYRAAGQLAGGRTSSKFSVVLGLLEKWFNAHKNRSAELKEVLAGGRPVGPEDICEKFSSKPGQTPLHLLSEVAMGEPNNRSTSNPTSTTPATTYISSYHPHPHPPSTPSSATNLVSPNQLPSADPGTTSTSVSDTWPQYPQPQPDSTRPFYPPFSSTPSAAAPSTTYADMPGAGVGYPDLSAGANVGMPGMNLEFFVPELGMQVGFNPENLLALERMMGDGFLNLPFASEGGMGYYS